MNLVQNEEVRLEMIEAIIERDWDVIDNAARVASERGADEINFYVNNLTFSNFPPGEFLAVYNHPVCAVRLYIKANVTRAEIEQRS